MIWLYRLQQRLSITRHEGLAVLTLTLLFITGLSVRHIQNQQVPPIAVDSLVAKPAADTVRVASQADAPPSDNDPINLNTASEKTLQALNGIGPALAERIVEYRNTQRPFQRIDELQRVRGIGPRTLDEIRPRVRVSPPDLD